MELHLRAARAWAGGPVAELVILDHGELDLRCAHHRLDGRRRAAHRFCAFGDGVGFTVQSPLEMSIGEGAAWRNICEQNAVPFLFSPEKTLPRS